LAPRTISFSDEAAVAQNVTFCSGSRQNRENGVSVLSLRKPSDEMARLFVDSQRGLPLTYAAVGATAQTPPADFLVDQTRIRLGEGEAILHSAKSVLQRWEQFQLGWVDIWSPQTLIQVGEIVAVMGYAPGLWWLNASRIVNVVVESGLINQ